MHYQPCEAEASSASPRPFPGPVWVWAGRRIGHCERYAQCFWLELGEGIRTDLLCNIGPFIAHESVPRHLFNLNRFCWCKVDLQLCRTLVDDSRTIQGGPNNSIQNLLAALLFIARWRRWESA